MAYINPLKHWQRGDRLTHTRLNSMVDAINRSNNISTSSIDLQINNTPVGHEINSNPHFQRESFPAHVYDWDGTKKGYSWLELTLNAARTGYDIFGDCRQSGDEYADGTLIFGVAVHASFIEDLPGTTSEPLLVTMTLAPDVNDLPAPTFEVPVQLDSVFAHRSSAGGSPTLGERADLTRAVNSATTDTNKDWNISGQANDKKGYVTTVMLGFEVDESDDAKIKAYWRDEEYDVMGRHISSSEVFSTEIHEPDAC